MPYELKVDGMEEISETLTKLEEKASGVAARALYEGAGIMAGEINQSAKQIKTAPFEYAKDGQTRFPSAQEKAIVERAAAGIAKFNKNGAEVDTSVGFSNAGYAELAGKTVPVPKIVNAINSGTSFMQPQAFIRKAKTRGGHKAMQAMKESIEKDFEEITKAR